MKKRLLVYGLVLVLAIPLAMGLQDFVRDVIVIPLLFIPWFAKLLLKSISQSNLWVIFLLLPLVFFVKSLKRLSTPPKTMDKTPEDVTGTVTIWAERLRNAEKGIHYDRSLKQHLGKLFFSILAYNTGTNPEQIRRSMESEDLEAPSAIQAYVKAGDGDIPPTRFRSKLGSLFRSWTRKREVPPLKTDTENVVKFLEKLLKVKHDR
jgi:membrane protein implicated in regulation of membrane protease activity